MEKMQGNGIKDEFAAALEESKEEKILFEWEAPERAFQRRDRDFWITSISILILFSVILIFIKEFYLIIALVSVLFMFYGLSTVPPETVKNKISNKGVYFGEALYEWQLLYRFWFKESLSSQMIFFETNLRFPSQISLVIDPKDMDKIKQIVKKRLSFVQASPTFTDKLSTWVMARLPLENRKNN